MSLRQYAKTQGVSHTAIEKRIKNGKIPKQPDGKIDSEAADAAWKLSESPGEKIRKATLARNRGEAPDHLGPFFDSRQKRELLRLHREGFEFEKLRGKFVLREEVEDQAFRRARDERDALLAWPNRIAAILAGDLGIDEQTLHTHLERYVRAFLDERSEVGPLLDK